MVYREPPRGISVLYIYIHIFFSNLGTNELGTYLNSIEKYSSICITKGSFLVKDNDCDSW